MGLDGEPINYLQTLTRELCGPIKLESPEKYLLLTSGRGDTLRYWTLNKHMRQESFQMKGKDVSTAVCVALQGEVGGPGQKGSKGDKGELVSLCFFSLLLSGKLVSEEESS